MRAMRVLAALLIAIVFSWAALGEDLVLEFPNGDRFTGSFDGFGIMEFGGARYEGSFSRGAFDGHGVLKLANGDQYEGGFQGGAVTGSGIYEFASGARFEGAFVDGKPSGEGALTLSDGTRFEGVWNGGAPSSAARFSSAAKPEDAELCFFDNCD